MLRKIRDIGMLAIMASIVIIIDFVVGFGPTTFYMTALAVIGGWHLLFEVLAGRSID